MHKHFAEFFAGIGLVRAGLETSGWQCSYANDIDPKKREMYEGHFGPCPKYHCGDIWDLAAVLDRLPRNLSMATASFPCIDVSIAGHWRGLDGVHSSTFFAFLEVIKAMGKQQPPILLIENVVGFVKSNQGKDFCRACEAIAGHGYWLDSFILDAKWFVPQSRPRVFIVAVSEELRESDRFVDSKDLFGDAADGGDEVIRPAHLVEVCSKAALRTGWVRAVLPNVPKRETLLSDVLDADDDQEWWDEADVNRHLELMQTPSRDRLKVLLGSPRMRTGTAFRRTRLGKPRTEVRFDLAGCLRTPKGGSARQIVVRVGKGRVDLRWMSAREYARLQGIPEFRFRVPEQQAMYGFGDAVCVPAVQWIDRYLLSPLVQSRVTAVSGARPKQVLAG